MEGQLSKYTNFAKGWQYRWFVLDSESGMLEYFEKEEHKKQRPRGFIHLAVSSNINVSQIMLTYTLKKEQYWGTVFRKISGPNT